MILHTISANKNSVSTTTMPKRCFSILLRVNNAKLAWCYIKLICSIFVIPDDSLYISGGAAKAVGVRKKVGYLEIPLDKAIIRC